jgi:cytochrome d ubiquinol oxidase subunit II
MTAICYVGTPSGANCFLALCLLLRGIALEVGGHINDRLWQGFWDFVFVVSSFLLAVLFGAAAGNLARGVPLDAQGNFYMAFFTNFKVVLGGPLPIS